MKQLTVFPPNYRQIVRAFPQIRHKAVIFCYGDTIYNPHRTKIQHTLIEHERVHSGQQHHPAAWWERYIDDRKFRLEQELPAHIAEYKAMATPRQLKAIAERLASSLYGGLIDYERAKELILSGAHEAQLSTASTQISDQRSTSCATTA